MMKNVIAAMVVVGLFASTSQAVQRVISINFDDGNNAVTSAAGFVPATNWNNLSGGTITGLVLQDNTGATDMDGFGANVTLTTVQSFNGTMNTPGGGATAGDAKLFFQGTRSVYDGSNEQTQVLLQGLATAFPNGYDVYIYTGDSSYGHAYPQGTNSIYESNTAGDYTVGRINSPSGAPANLTDTKTWTAGNGSTFNGVYTQGTNYVLFSGKSAADAVYTMFMAQAAAGGTFNWGNFPGMQIVGEIDEIPEPSTFVLAGMGLLGLVGFGLRRRQMKK